MLGALVVEAGGADGPGPGGPLPGYIGGRMGPPIGPPIIGPMGPIGPILLQEKQLVNDLARGLNAVEQSVFQQL